MDPFAIVHAALAAAHSEPRPEENRRDLHRARSKALVEAVGEQMRRVYAAEPDVRVFTKHHDGNRADFGLNELLYDVCVCRVGSVGSSVQRKTLWYVREVCWQVESELARNGRQALFDFNKLVLGTACTKLFIGPLVHDPESYIEILRRAARSCSGKVHCALVPHPDEWDGPARVVLCYSLVGGHWERQPAPV